MNPAVAVVVHRDAIRAAAERHHLTNVKVHGAAANGVWDHQIGLIVEPIGPDAYADVLAFWDEVADLTGCVVEVLHASSFAARRVASNTARLL